MGKSRKSHIGHMGSEVFSTLIVHGEGHGFESSRKRPVEMSTSSLCASEEGKATKPDADTSPTVVSTGQGNLEH